MPNGPSGRKNVRITIGVVARFILSGSANITTRIHFCSLPDKNAFRLIYELYGEINYWRKSQLRLGPNSVFVDEQRVAHLS